MYTKILSTPVAFQRFIKITPEFPTTYINPFKELQRARLPMMFPTQAR